MPVEIALKRFSSTGSCSAFSSKNGLVEPNASSPVVYKWLFQIEAALLYFLPYIRIGQRISKRIFSWLANRRDVRLLTKIRILLMTSLAWTVR